MSAGACSGGYPCGYGTHFPNCCGKIQKLGDKMTVRGVSHLHHSGTGAIQYYYNYAITTPFYGDVAEITKYYELENEEAQPGYYKMTMNGIDVELTVSDDVAYHHYYFEKTSGRVAIDFSNDGLSKQFGEQFYAFSKQPYVEVTPFGEVLFSGYLSGVKLYFCAVIVAEKPSVTLFEDITETKEKSITPNPEKPFGAIFDFDGNNAIIKLAYSTIGFDEAKQKVRSATDSFDTVMNKAYGIWGKHLSRIEIETDDEELKGKFYSNLYHSLIKPVDMAGENLMGLKGDCITDISTFWDQYKTVFPLIFMVYPEFGSKLYKGIVNISKTFGKVLCSFGMSDIYPAEMQAKMLGIYALCDAYYYGIEDAKIKDIEECIKRELERDDFKQFIKKGTFERYTHIIDTTDACLYAAKLTDDLVLKHKLLELASNWKKAFDDDGIMSKNSPYY
jgi:putative alpha-1,2-mannosidase